MALGQGAGQERGQTHGCPWIWERLVGVSSSCQVASLAEPLPAVGQSSPSCTSSARACQTVGLTSFTCFFYIHGTNSFWGLPVPPGGRRLPLRELVFFRPLTLALAPLVPQGLLPRHNQNPLMKGTVLRRDPCPGVVSILVPGPSSVITKEVWTKGLAWNPGSQPNILQKDDNNLFLGPTIVSLYISRKGSKCLRSPDKVCAIPAGSMGQESATREHCSQQASMQVTTLSCPHTTVLGQLP